MSIRYSTPITTEHVHLGDLVNIVQSWHDIPCEFVGDFRCQCCGNKLSVLVPFLIGILPDCKMRYCEGVKSEIVVPSWMNGVNLRYYRKASNLPEKEDHVVCSFSNRSILLCDGEPPKSISERDIEIVVGRFGDRDIYNLSDVPLSGTIDATHMSIEEKFELVSSSSTCVSTDNGIAHLSLMTNSKTIVVHKSGWNARRFYPLEGVEYWKAEDL